MIPSLSQETLTQYASDAQTIQEPTGTDYSKGVSAGRTIPAKWWNWLFSAVTKRAGQSKTDAQNMLTELTNVVTDAGITPDAEDDTQLSQAVAAKADAQINNFVSDKLEYMQKWFIAGTEGLPNMPGASGWRYRFERLHCVHGVYFAFVRVAYGNSSVDVYNYIVYSYDLDTWHQLKPSDLGGSAALDEDYLLETAVVYFKGAWYFALQGTPSSYGQGINGHFLLTKVPDLENLSTKTVLYNSTHAAGPGAEAFRLFVLGNYLCWKNTTQTPSEIAISTDGTNFTIFDTGTALIGYYSDVAVWGVPEIVPFNGGYLVGSILVNADLTSWTEVATAVGGQMDCHVALLASGVAVFYQIAANIKFVEYISPGESSATKVEDFILPNTGLDFTHDKKYVFSANYTACKITSDFTDITTLSHGSPGVMMDTIDDELYTIDVDHTIIKCTDISQDTWVSTGNTAPGDLSGFIVLGNERVLGSGANVSIDLGATWKPSKDTKGRNFNIRKINFIQDGKYFVQKGTTWFSEDNPGQKPDILFYAQRTVNYVQGHTLYLR